MEAKPGVQEAAAYLRELLVRPGAYRQRWERRAERPRKGEINQRAVCKVLARQLWEEGLDLSEASLKDRVSRALRGDVLSPETLTLFVKAFDVSEEDTQELWTRLFNSSADRVAVVTGGLRPPPTYPVETEARQYRTVSLHEFHRVGADGLPADHRTIHVVEALSDGLARYPYRFDTNAAVVEVVRGGKASPLYQFDEKLYAVDILFARPLQQGETASLEYLTLFHYRTPPPREFRRAVYRRVESLQIRVEFHPQKLPSFICWGEWTELDGPITRQEEVVLDDELAVHRYLTAVEQAIVGFYWDW